MSTEKCWYEKMEDSGLEKSKNLIEEAIQDYTEKICYAISPIDSRDMPFILTALKSIVESLSKDDELADFISGLLIGKIVTQKTNIPVPKNATREDIDRIKEQIFRRDIFSGGGAKSRWHSIEHVLIAGLH